MTPTRGPEGGASTGGRLEPWVERGGAGALSGILCALAMPPFPFWPLAFVGLVPFARAIATPRAGRDVAVRNGLAFGVLFYGILLHWVPATLHGLVPAGAVTGILAILILAGVTGVQAVALRQLIIRSGMPVVVALPLVWVGFEALLVRAGPLAFPWLPLGLSLGSRPEIAGIAELGGVALLTAWMVLVNGALVGALSPGGWSIGGGGAWRGGRILVVLAMAGLVVGPAAWGTWRVSGLPMEELPPVQLVQIGPSRDLLLDPGRRDEAVRAAIEQVVSGSVPLNSRGPGPGTSGSGMPESAAPVRSSDDESPVLIILPEAPFSARWDPDVERFFAELAAGHETSILVGSHFRGGPVADGGAGQGGEDDLFNALVLLDPDGSTAAVHLKGRLVPGVERPGLTSGSPGEVIDLAGLRIGFLICFEAAFGRESRDYRAAGANLLVNPSNDGWFLPRGGGGGSAAHAQHRAHLVMRAVELRIGAVRSSIGGSLLAVGADGGIVAEGTPGEAGSVTVRVGTSPQATLYARTGDVAGWLGMAGLILGLLIPVRRVLPGRAGA
jgi:apolipoprotein N-acyltransferase